MSADHPMLKEIKIDSIRVGRRHRRDMGDLTALADSIRQERGTQEDEPNRESGGVPSTSLFR